MFCTGELALGQRGPPHGSSTAEVAKSEEVDKSEPGERLVLKFLLCNVQAKGEGPSVGEGVLLWEVAGSMEAGLEQGSMEGGGQREEESTSRP